MPDPTWGEVGVAVCVARAGADVDAEADLRAWLEPRMARYKVPRHVVFWDELPKSGYGKVVKRTIRAQLLSEGWSAEGGSTDPMRSRLATGGGR